MPKEPCPICDGEGHLDDVDPHGRVCRNCGGTGERRPAHVDPKPTIAPGTLHVDPDLCPACRGTGIDNGMCHNCGGWGSVTVYHRQGKVFRTEPWTPERWSRT